VCCDHGVHCLEEGAIAGDEAVQHAESGGRREPGGPVSGAVGEDGEHVGLVQEDVVVHQVAQLSVNDPERTRTGPQESDRKGNTSCRRKE
jgi:hypothetical protein